jgi:WD40 repeat protein
MSESKAPPWLFLSHSGADTEAARDLKRRLLDSADAREAGLRVWLDKDDLAAGTGWQGQLEKVITEQSTAFAVHVGAKGIVNWVESEVRLGLSRATTASNYPFIPILAKECSGSAALPPFARQFEAVRDPLNKPDELVKLLRAVLRRSADEKTIVLDSPFVGLKAMTEADADRFFGRNEEIAEIIAKLKQHRLVAIVADSGAGKSSLAQAGLVPAFRGGALADAGGREPDDRLWHVVVMRPRRDPMEGLRRGVTEAAERLGRCAEECAALRKRIQVGDPSEAAYAIRCDLPVAKTQTLLIVDQFEELLTETGEGQRGPYVDLLMALEAAGGFWIVLTLRVDHFNLCRPLVALFEHLTRDNQDAVLRLRRITDAGIAEAVRNPLRLAGHTDAAEQDALIGSIRRDITDRAGDLALVQMALYAMWQKHQADHVDLLVAYAQLGGVVGALAHEAEHVRTQRLDATERVLLGSIFVRLVRLGETGGATRRAGDLADFEGPRRALIAKLATEECGRLLFAGERSVEIAHEALITQWPWLQNTLNEASGDIRVLDRLMDKAHRWNTIGSRAAEHLATGAEREEFGALAECHPEWPSRTEGEFIAASDAAEGAARKDREGQRARARWATIGIFLVGLIALAGALYQMRETAKREAIVLTTLAHRAVADQKYETAMKIGVHGLPAPGSSPLALGWSRPEMSGLEAKLAGAAQLTPLVRELKGHSEPVLSAAFSADGARIVTASGDKTARLWDAASGEMLRELKGPGGAVKSCAFSADGRRIVTASRDGTARVWDAVSAEMLRELKGHGWPVNSAAFSTDGARIVTASDDKTARVWDAASGEMLRELKGHGGAVTSAAFSTDGARIVTASDDRTARVWHAASGETLRELKHGADVRNAAFSADGARIVTASDDQTARVWDAASGEMLRELKRHGGSVMSAAFSTDGGRIVTASGDRTARVWDAASGEMLRELKGHGDAVMSAAFSSDGRRIVTASWDRTARVWDPARGGMLHELRGHGGPVNDAAFNADGARIVTASEDARVWDAASGEMLRELKGHGGAVTSAAFSTDGGRIVTASDDRTARVWHADSGEMLRELKHGAGVRNAAFSADGRRIVTASGDKTARVWDADSGEMLRELKDGAGVRNAAFSPDGRRIVTASDDRTARVWDAASGEMLRELKGHNDALTSAAFGPDGRRIVTASWDQTARVWDAASGEMLRELKGHGGWIMSAAFSTDGERIVTASWDSTAQVWDAASGEMLRELKGHGHAVTSAAFSTDGKRIVTASGDETARVWDVRLGMTIRREELVRRVCAEKLVGGQTFTIQEATDPILAGLVGRNPCEKYRTNFGSNSWN